MNKEDIITALKEAVIPDEEYYIDSEIIDAMLEYPDPFQFVKPILEIISQNPSVDFGSPGELVHFVEKFYKKGYEEELIASLKRMPSLHTIWMLNRLINGTDNPENYLSLMKEISQSETYSKEIRDQALYFLSDN